MAIDLDLDVLAPPDRHFRLGGRSYRLPGDLPARTVVRFMRISGRLSMETEDIEENADAMNEMVEMVAKLIHRFNPDVPVDEIAEEMSVTQMSQIVALAVGQPGVALPDAVVDTLVAGQQPEADEVDRDDPTVPTPTGQAAA